MDERQGELDATGRYRQALAKRDSVLDQVLAHAPTDTDREEYRFYVQFWLAARSMDEPVSNSEIPVTLQLAQGELLDASSAIDRIHRADQAAAPEGKSRGPKAAGPVP